MTLFIALSSFNKMLVVMLTFNHVVLTKVYLPIELPAVYVPVSMVIQMQSMYLFLELLCCSAVTTVVV